MNHRRVILSASIILLLCLTAGLTASTAQVQVDLGAPGLSYRYTQTLGETEVPYFGDSEHINLPWGIGGDGTNLWIAEMRGGRALKFTSDGTFVMQIGTAGLGNLEKLPNITAVGIDNSGNVYLVDGSTHHILVYDPTGVYLSELGEAGNCSSDNNRFCIPSGIAFDTDGNIYVSDNGNSRIQILDSTGAYIATIGQTGVPGQGNDQFDQPEHIAVYVTLLYVADSNNQRVQIFDISNPTSPVYFATMGETGVPGDDNDHFACPNGVSFSVSGIFIADACNNRIQVFDQITRDYAGTIGSGPGQGDTEFDTPTDVVVDAAGNVYVADLGNTRVQQFDDAWAYVRTYGTTRVPYLTDGYHYNGTSSMAVDSLGNIFITETWGFRLIKLDSTGTFQWTVGQAGMWGSDDSHFGSWLGVGPLAVAADGTGGAYAADTTNHRVVKCSSAGECVTFAGVTGEAGSDDNHFNTPLGLAVDLGGNVYVGDTRNERVQKCTPEGTCSTFAGVTGEPGNDNGHFNVPTGVTVDAGGNVYVADTANQRIQKFDGAGTWLLQLGVTEESGSDFGHFSDPRDVAVDSAGRIFISDANNNRVQVFDAAGAYLTTIGGSQGANSGQLRYTPGVDFDTQGNLYVADENNFRVQVFAQGVPHWKQVNINGFGDPNNWAINRMSIFNGKMYIGTYNHVSGGSVWSFDDAHTWTKVSADGFGNEANIDALPGESFNGYLYAGTENSSSGAEIWRTSDGSSWEQVVTAGFGDETNFDVERIIVFNNMLYATTDNSVTGVEVWRSSTGEIDSWQQVNEDGFGTSNNNGLWGAEEFNGYLYVATATWVPPVTGVEVWRTDNGTNWEQVNINGFGDPNNINPWIEAYNGNLYLLTANFNTGVQLWRCTVCDGSDWEQIISDGFGNINNYGGGFMIAYNGRLFATTSNSSTGNEIWNSSDGIQWNQVMAGGFGDSSNVEIWSGAIFQESLYFSTVNDAGYMNPVHGTEIWRYASFLYMPIMVK